VVLFSAEARDFSLFFTVSSLALGPIQLPTHWYWVLSQGKSSQGVKLATDLILFLRSTVSEIITPLPYGFMVCTGTALFCYLQFDVWLLIYSKCHLMRFT